MSSQTKGIQRNFTMRMRHLEQWGKMAVFFMRVITMLAALSLWLTAAAKAEFLLSGKAIQGGIIIGVAPQGSIVSLDGERLNTDKEGRFLIGFHRDDKRGQLLQIQFPDGSNQVHIITPEPREWDIQRIDGLAQKYVTPPDEVLARITSDRDAVRKARQARLEHTQIFETGFRWPVSGPVTGVYGSQRILNGTPRQPHFGIDIAAEKGTDIIASAPGLVTMAKDLYYTGWTIIIDHGLGLNSTYSHLEKVSVKSGQLVDRDTVIGTVGSTGRSTGAHLDWRVNLGTKRLDPQIVAHILHISELN